MTLTDQNESGIQNTCHVSHSIDIFIFLIEIFPIFSPPGLIYFRRDHLLAMTHPPRITDESVLARWMGLEIAKMNEGLVTQRKSLVVLLGQKDPVSVTKKGDTYHFDASVIATLGKALAEDLQRQLRLPVLFYASPDTPGSFSCPDAPALAALQQLGEVSTLRTFEGGKFWVSRPIVYAIMKKYPTVFQIVMGG
jgi:uncharacterized protein (UPF0216 family)